MTNEKEALMSQSVKDELERIRAEFEDFISPKPETETLSIELPVAVSLMLENMAYDCRRDEKLSNIENLTKQRLCALLLDAIVMDYQAVGIENLTKGLIEYMNEYYERIGLELT